MPGARNRVFGLRVPDLTLLQQFFSALGDLAWIPFRIAIVILLPGFLRLYVPSTFRTSRNTAVRPHLLSDFEDFLLNPPNYSYRKEMVPSLPPLFPCRNCLFGGPRSRFFVELFPHHYFPPPPRLPRLLLPSPSAVEKRDSFRTPSLTGCHWPCSSFHDLIPLFLSEALFPVRRSSLSDNSPLIPIFEGDK